MAFIQQHKPQAARQSSFHDQEAAPEVATSPQQLKRPLDQSEEWVLFSPNAPSTTARTHTTSTDRTPRTAGLSRFSEFGSLDTAARSDHDDDDVGTVLGTEEELDSLDDGLHAFHEPSEYGAPVGRLQESGDTVLPTHDGLGEFQPDATMQEHMWQFERPRRRVRRRSSVQRHFSTLDDTDEINQEQDRRQRIEKWRLEQSKALLEEIEKETRRRRRMSTFSARSRAGNTLADSNPTEPQVARSVSDTCNDSSDEGTESLSFWQRITRRVIRDLIGLDEDTLSVIFGESLPEEATLPKQGPSIEFQADKALQEAGIDISTLTDDSWQTKLLERVAEELGTLVHQLSEHPGAFSTYQGTQAIPEFVGLSSIRSNPTSSTNLASLQTTSTQTSTTTPASAQFAPTFPAQTQHTYSEASLWGIEEEPEPADPLDSFRAPPPTTANIAEDLARERAYWERELDVKMIFNFLIKRFTSERSGVSSPPRRASSAPSVSAVGTDEGVESARRAAMIRQHHPLVSRTTDRGLPTSSSPQTREVKRKDLTYRTYFTPQNALRHQKLRSNSSCASQSTKKSKISGSSRNYWDIGGSVGSGSVMAGEV